MASTGQESPGGNRDMAGSKGQKGLDSDVPDPKDEAQRKRELGDDLTNALLNRRGQPKGEQPKT